MYERKDGLDTRRGIINDLVLNHAAVLSAEAEELRLVAAYCDACNWVEPSEQPGAEDLVARGSDGTPLVAEFAHLELCGVLGISPIAAADLMRDVLNLRYRHPFLWGQALGGDTRAWVARKISAMCMGLPLEAALALDCELGEAPITLPWSRVEKLVTGLIAAVQPEIAELKRADVLASRYVRLGKLDAATGTRHLIAKTDATQALFFNAMVQRIADILGEQGDKAGNDERRSKAIGLLASPAHALQMLQRAAQPSDDREAEADDSSEPAVDPHYLQGHLCGQVTVPPRKLLPKAVLYIHLAEETLREGGVARVEGIGPIELTSLRGILGQCQVKVQPVIDLNSMPPVDAYEVPRRMREALTLRNPYEVFPFSSYDSRHLDADHSDPYRWTSAEGGPPPGQTRLGNLGPLSRTVHRAGTHGGFEVKQIGPDWFVWKTRLGLRYLLSPGAFVRLPDKEPAS